jgi:Dolichyl-phosphate-mannose-protein mannosyltransferase
LAFGIVVRILAFAHHRRLDLDEAMLALDLTARSLGGLSHPLGFEQAAPILFLWTSRIAIVLCGVTEQTLRLLPFVAGLALVPCVWYAARRLLRSSDAAMVAAAVAAVSPIAMFYANFLKPYAVDAAVTALLLWLVTRVINAPASRSVWWSLGVTAAVATFLSAPSVFVTAAALAAIAMSPAGRDAAARRRIALVAIAWAGCAAVNFLALQRSTVGNPYMQHYWAGAFLLPPLGHVAELARARIGWAMQETFLGDGVPYSAAIRILLAAVGATGLIAIGRQRGVWCIVLLLGPVLLAAASSTLRLYPLSERTLLFVAPIVIVAAVAGVEALAGLAARRAQHVRLFAFAAFSALLLLPATIDSALRLRRLLRPDSFRSTIADVVQQASQGAPVYVFTRDVPIWAFYTTDWNYPDTARIRMLTDASASTGPNSGNMPGRGHPVENEGRDLIIRSGRRVELIGVPTGMQARFADVSQQAPDRGWATNEADRIRAAADPGIWLFFTYCHNLCDRTLSDTLGASGGRFVYERITRDVRLYEYVRDPAARTTQ